MLSLPSISVVIPVYNRRDLLESCLLPLMNQSYSSDRYEIILVDDGSTDGTPQQAQTITSGWGGHFRVISQANGGPASARNAGLEVSEADIVAFIDSDCVADHDWLEQLVSALTDSQADGVGGPIVSADTENWVVFYLETKQFYRHRIRNGKVDYLVSGNVAFRRSALVGIRGFKAARGIWVEDVDLSFRLIDAGYKLTVSDKGTVTHLGSPKSIPELARNLFRYGKGNYMLSKTWNRNRKPLVEFTRHFGAIILAPYLALKYAHKVRISWAFVFWPLIVVEHGAFCAGIISGALQARSQQFESSKD